MQRSANNVDAFPLGQALRGFVRIIDRIVTNDSNSALEHEELESRLIEFGFVDGAPVEILHEGLIGGDPIAVRVQGITIALRRLEAMAVLVRSEQSWNRR